MKIMSVTIYNRHGNHDKVYVVWVDQRVDGRFDVGASWGRRSTFQTGGIAGMPSKVYFCERQEGVAEDRMLELIAGKIDTGYTTNEDGVTGCSRCADRHIVRLTEFRMTGTQTGRVSSAPNVQTIPPATMREFEVQQEAIERATSDVDFTDAIPSLVEQQQAFRASQSKVMDEKSTGVLDSMLARHQGAKNPKKAIRQRRRSLEL